MSKAIEKHIAINALVTKQSKVKEMYCDIATTLNHQKHPRQKKIQEKITRTTAIYGTSSQSKNNERKKKDLRLP